MRFKSVKYYYYLRAYLFRYPVNQKNTKLRVISIISHCDVCVDRLLFKGHAGHESGPCRPWGPCQVRDHLVVAQ